MKQINLSRIQDAFAKKIENFLRINDVQRGDLAKAVELNLPTLSALLSPNTDGTYKKPLSSMHLYRFIEKGVITVDDVYDYKPESHDEEKYFRIMKLVQYPELIKDLEAIEKMGGNPSVHIKIIRNKMEEALTNNR